MTSKPFQEWVNDYTGDLLRWAMQRVSDKEVAKDLVQDTFVAAWEQREKFEGRSHPKTWLMGILKNKISDHFRKVYSRSTLSLEGNPFFTEDGNWEEKMAPRDWSEETRPELMDQPGFHAVLNNCLEKLNMAYRAVVQAKYLESLEPEFICQELGISSSNYWQIIHRSKLQMRKCLEINWFKL